MYILQSDRKKGIDDAVETIIAVNKELGRTVFTLDIYGQVDEEYKEHFEALMASSPESVNYKGTVAFNQSVDVLKKYYALLFPTKFYTEGIPGTIIDAYAAGVPVIASKWENYDDVVDEGIVGKGFEFNNQEELKNILLYITTSPECLLQMKKNCLIKAADFSANKIISGIIGGGYL